MKNAFGYKVKLQKIERPTDKTFCVTVPVVMAEAMELKKGGDSGNGIFRKLQEAA